MTRHKDWVQPIDKRTQSDQMCAIDAIGAADRDPDRVNGNRIVAGEIRQQFETVRIREEVLRIPNQLGVEYNAHVLESILKYVAPELGWR